MSKIIGIKGDIIPNNQKFIYDWMQWDSTSPNDIISVLNEVNGTEDIIIEMNSGGGNVITAHEIYSAIAGYKGNIEIHVMGLAGSAASEILTACKSKISPVGLVMIHNCMTNASGDYREMDSTSQMLQEVNQSIRNAYKAKTGLADEQLIELMNNTTWMSAQKAIDIGIVDELLVFDSQNSDALNEDGTIQPALALYNAGGIVSPDIVNKLGTIIIEEKSKSLLNGNNGPLSPSEHDEIKEDLILNKDIHEGGTKMNLQELIKEHPELENEISQLKITAREEGKAEGVAAERSRLQAIDNIAKSIPEDLVNQAKYSEVMNASDLALKVIENTAQAGATYFKAAVQDNADSGVNDVTTDPSDTSAEDEEEALMNVAIKAANSKRKAVN